MRTLMWSIPQKIINDPSFTKIQLWKGTNESDVGTYSILVSLDRWGLTGGIIDYEKEVSSYNDSTGTDAHFYFIKYFNPESNISSKILEVLNELNPKQVRMASTFRRYVDPIVASIIEVDGTFTPFTDEDSFQSLELGAGFLSSYTSRDMSVNNIDKKYESLLYLVSLQLCLLVKGLGISLRDFSYSDNGLSLAQDMGGKVSEAYTKIAALIETILKRVRLDVGFSSDYTDDLFLGSYNIAVGGGMVGLNKAGGGRSGINSGRSSQPVLDYGGMAFVDIWNLLK